MTNEQKLKLVLNSKEVGDAFKMLVAVYHDCNLKHFLRFSLRVNDYDYEITFLEVGKPEKVKLNSIDKP